MMRTKLHVFVDSDGVLANFMKKAREIKADEDAKLKWKKLESVPNLFRHLEPLPDAKEGFKHLIEFCSDYACVPVVLTALPKPTGLLHTAAKDKTEWFREHFHPTIQVICSDGWENKISFMGTGINILIDDMKRNIDHWHEHGGAGIHHVDWQSTIKKLQDSRWLLDQYQTANLNKS